jgi:ribonuclease Z
MDYDGYRLTRGMEFHARQAFARRAIEPPSFPDGIVWVEDDFRIEAVALDHGIPSLAFALKEVLQVNVWRGVLPEMGLAPGPWLNKAKRAVRLGAPDDLPIDLPGGSSIPLGDLKQRVLRVAPGQVVAYVTDTAPHRDNREKILQLARGADNLFIEAVFLERDRALAVAAHHLTAAEAGALAREAGVRQVTPFHFSARYVSDPDALRREVFNNFKGRTGSATTRRSFAAGYDTPNTAS